MTLLYRADMIVIDSVFFSEVEEEIFLLFLIHNGSQTWERDPSRDHMINLRGPEIDR